jgi:DNA-binding LacI/PurR family transcriptional regulator
MGKDMPKPASVLTRAVHALRREVQRHAGEGDRLDTIAVLARRLGVSTNTVRSALTILQQEGLVEMRHGSGTYVRRRPARGKHVALVVEVDLLHPVTSFFWRDMFRRLRNCLMDSGVEARIYSGAAVPGVAEPFYSEVAGRQLVSDLDRVSAVAAFLMLPDEPWIDPVRSRGIPVVSNVPELGPSVNSDREGMVRQAVAALAARGCRRLGFMSWGTPRGLAQLQQATGRMETVFARSASEWGLETRPEWICTTGNPSENGAGWESFRELWLSSRDRPDGLVIDDDQLLAGALDALRDSAIPAAEQPLIATHFTEGAPIPIPVPLIKLVYSPEEHARAMADLVLDALAGNADASRQVTLAHRLVLPGVAARGGGGLEVSQRDEQVRPLPTA